MRTYDSGLDRREQDRGSVDRRRSSRWTPDRLLCWRVFRGRRLREGWIVERSLNGFVLATLRCDAVPAGTRIIVKGGRDEFDKLGFRSAIVRRTDPGEGSRRMLIAEIDA